MKLIAILTLDGSGYDASVQASDGSFSSQAQVTVDWSKTVADIQSGIKADIALAVSGSITVAPEDVLLHGGPQ